jgi:hypothetical protein
MPGSRGGPSRAAAGSGGLTPRTRGRPPLGATVAYALVGEVGSLLPVSLGFAAGAMLAVVFPELVPDLWRFAIRTQSTR